MENKNHFGQFPLNVFSMLAPVTAQEKWNPVSCHLLSNINIKHIIL